MTRIIDTTNPNYIAYCRMYHHDGKGAHNGAYYYSKEIVKNIIPNVKTNRPWDTLGMKFAHAGDHAIVFLHYNLNHDRTYRHLQRFKDLVYVCSVKQTYEWAQKQSNGHAIFLPLSIDTEYVKQFKVPKTKQACYAGNKWAFKLPDLKRYIPEEVDFPPDDLPRDKFLEFIAPYEECYAVGRTAIEAKCLGCTIKVCDSRYPDPSIWRVIDNFKAAILLQEKLDCLDDPLGKPSN